MSNMPPLRSAKGLLIAGLAAVMLPAVAHADTIVIDATGATTRTVPVKISDLNLTSQDGRARLETRIAIASRRACHIMDGSALNRSEGAMACLASARDGAWSQVDTRTASASAAPLQVAYR